MSHRWKYQIKIGLFWGLFMSGFNLLFDLQEKPIGLQLAEKRFYFRLLVHVLVGIFIMGFLFWKGQDPNNNSWSRFLKNKKQS